jgi:hypothetical protein
MDVKGIERHIEYVYSDPNHQSLCIISSQSNHLSYMVCKVLKNILFNSLIILAER